MDINEGSKGITLRKVDAKGAQRIVELSREGAELITRVSAGGKAPKETRKKCKDDAAASREYGKALRAKVRDGHALIGGQTKVKRGQVVFAGFASGGGGGPVLDLAPDGRSLLTAGCRGAPTSVWVELVDTQTGARRVVFEKSHKQQLFLHAALFVGGGSEILVALDDETLVVSLATGKARRVAAYREGKSSCFNPHVLRPQGSADRSRVMIFDADSVVRVVDASFATLIEVSTASPTSECRAAALSPSGRLLAVYRVSRFIVYGHDDAKKDKTSAIELWDVDLKKKIGTWPVGQQVGKMGFDAADSLLLASWDFASGPVALDLKTGKEAYRFEVPGESELATAHHWAFSPDGAWLAIASHQTELRDAGTRKPTKIEAVGHGSRIVVFSGDGSRLASYEDGLAIVRAVR